MSLVQIALRRPYTVLVLLFALAVGAWFMLARNGARYLQARTDYMQALTQSATAQYALARAVARIGN
ncbi:MAG: hypothetical protein JWM63_3861 [Gammaproteobacteria bacterium]|jgi:hypothetical protein|nr:hypothetical protein [Gammaproteobacteria bacterium]